MLMGKKLFWAFSDARDIVITQFGHNENTLQILTLYLGT